MSRVAKGGKQLIRVLSKKKHLKKLFIKLRKKVISYVYNKEIRIFYFYEKAIQMHLFLILCI